MPAAAKLFFLTPIFLCDGGCMNRSYSIWIGDEQYYNMVGTHSQKVFKLLIIISYEIISLSMGDCGPRIVVITKTWIKD